MVQLFGQWDYACMGIIVSTVHQLEGIGYPVPTSSLQGELTRLAPHSWVSSPCQSDSFLLGGLTREYVFAMAICIQDGTMLRKQLFLYVCLEGQEGHGDPKESLELSEPGQFLLEK